MTSRYAPALYLFLSLCFVHAAGASTRCYDPYHFPTVLELRKAEADVLALLGGQHLDRNDFGPVLRFSAKGQWLLEAESRCASGPCETRHEPEQCMRTIHKVLAEQGERRSVSGCVMHDESVYFGFHAYQGEGENQQGGIGRYHTSSGQLEIRNLPQIHDMTVHRLVHDGEWLWLATTYSSECGGTLPGLPLSRYHWHQERWETPTVQGCGLINHDLLLEGEHLWVASDNGLSKIRYREIGRENTQPVLHYAALDPGSPIPVEIGCESLYDRLLDTVPDVMGGADGYSPFGMLFSALLSQQRSYLERRFKHYVARAGLELPDKLKTAGFEQQFLHYSRHLPADQLWEALHTQNIDMLGKLLAEGVSPWWRRVNAPSPLHTAMESGDLSMLQLLHSVQAVDWAADPARPATALQLAYDQPEVFDWLLKQGARGNTPLLRKLVIAGDSQAVSRVLRNGLLRDSEYYDSTLIYALEKKQLEIAGMLLDAGLVEWISGINIDKHPMMLALQHDDPKLARRMVSLPLQQGQLDWLYRRGYFALLSDTAAAHAPLGRQAVPLFEQALQDGEFGIAQALLQYGLELSERQLRGIFSAAFERGDDAALDMLMRQGIAEQLGAGMQGRLLPVAVRLGLHDFVLRAIANGVRPDGLEGYRLIVETLRRGDAPMVQALLSSGMALRLGRWSNDVNLLQFNRAMNVTCANKPFTPACDRSGSLLVEAARSGRPEMLPIVLAAGADPVWRDVLGGTLLLAAAAGGNLETISFALEHGGQWSERDDVGNSALHYAVANGHYEAAGLVLAHAPELLDVENRTGARPLHLAAQQGDSRLVRLLLQHGARRDGRMWPGLQFRLSESTTPVPPAPGVLRIPAVTVTTPARPAFGEPMAIMGSVGGLNPGRREGPGLTSLELARQAGHDEVAGLLAE